MRSALLLILLAAAQQSAAQESFTVMRVIDGDTLIIGEPCSRFDQKTLMRVRLWGIDTPETRKPPAKCAAEIALGQKASEFSKSLVKSGQQVNVTFRARDKYACRIVGAVTLPDGRDMADVLIAAGLARPYGRDRILTKSNWCGRVDKTSAP